MDKTEQMAADIAMAMNGGEWKDGKWYAEGHRQAWIKAVKPYSDEIERLRGSYEDCINAVDTIINDGMTEPAKFAKIQHSGFTAYNYMIAMAEDIKDEIKKRAALKESK